MKRKRSNRNATTIANTMNPVMPNVGHNNSILLFHAKTPLEPQGEFRNRADLERRLNTLVQGGLAFTDFYVIDNGKRYLVEGGGYRIAERPTPWTATGALGNTATRGRGTTKAIVGMKEPQIIERILAILTAANHTGGMKRDQVQQAIDGVSAQRFNKLFQRLKRHDQVTVIGGTGPGTLYGAVTPVTPHAQGETVARGRTANVNGARA